MLEITYVTGNADKINSAKLYLEPLGVKVNHIKMESKRLGVNIVELYGIVKEGGHPTVIGMESIYEQVKNALDKE